MVWIALAIVYVVWGSTYFAIAYVVQTMPPLLTAGVRFFFAGLVLAAYIAATDRASLTVTRRQLASTSAVGILLLAGGNGLVSLGERTVASGLAALIIASVPLWIVILRKVAGDRIGRDLMIGVSVGIAGVAVLVVPSGASGQIETVGLVMLIGATFAWAFGTFISPRLSMPRSAFASTAYQMIAGGIVLTAAGLLLGEMRGLDPSRFSTASLAGFVYLVLFGSLAAFSAYTWLLQNAPVSLVSTYAYVNPVVAVFLGTLFLSEPITPTMIAGAALILAAVAFIVSRPRSAAGTSPARPRSAGLPAADPERPAAR
ncbi:MAG TPA: EamA family transporter [Candidatus Limnocylindrales bacterium]|nr:EamA family transporter [Candidatus Limnocylindrales bacterium]